jgi:serine/threonine protein kinase
LDVAIKRMRMAPSVDMMTAEFDQEVKVLRALRHRNIVFFHGAGTAQDRLPFLVMELCTRGSLFDVLHSDAILAETRLLRFAWDAASGMAFLHSLSPPRLHRGNATIEGKC